MSQLILTADGFRIVDSNNVTRIQVGTIQESISRWMFRNDVLLAFGDSLCSFDSISKQDDRMLSVTKDPEDSHEVWSAYRMALFLDNTWGWSPMPKDETDRLRALLLLQQ